MGWGILCRFEGECSNGERETQHRSPRTDWKRSSRHDTPARARDVVVDVSFLGGDWVGSAIRIRCSQSRTVPKPPQSNSVCAMASPARRTSPARTEGAPEGLARHTRLPEIGFFTFNSLASQPRDRTSHRANCRGQQPIRRRPVLSREPGNPLARDYTLCFSSPHPSGSAGPAMESPDFAAGMRSQGLNGSGPTKRKRSVLDSSPASLIDPDHDHDLDLDLDLDDRNDASPDAKSRRLPGVKRACNECRQQKVSQSVKPHVDSSIGPSPLPSPLPLSSLVPSRLRTSPPPSVGSPASEARRLCRFQPGVVGVAVCSRRRHRHRRRRHCCCCSPCCCHRRCASRLTYPAVS